MASIPSTHSSSHLYIHSFIDSLIDAFVHSLTHSFNHSLTSLTHSLNHSFIHTFIHPSSHSFIHSLVRSLTSLTPYSFICSFLHTFIHPVIHSFTRPSSHSFICLFVHLSKWHGGSKHECAWFRAVVQTWRVVGVPGSSSAVRCMRGRLNMASITLSLFTGLHHPKQAVSLLSSLQCSTARVSEGCLALIHWLLCGDR